MSITFVYIWWYRKRNFKVPENSKISISVKKSVLFGTYTYVFNTIPLRYRDKVAYTKVKVWHKIDFILGPMLTYSSMNLKWLETNFNLNCFVFYVSWSPPYLLSILGCGGLRANQICWRCPEHHIGVRAKQLHSIGVFRMWRYRWYSTIPNNE